MSIEGGSSDEGESFPAICPKCHGLGVLRAVPRLGGIKQIIPKADGTLEKEVPGKQGAQFGITCPGCGEKFWMLITILGGRALPDVQISSSPWHTMSENAGVVEPVTFFYDRERRWWFYKRDGKVTEFGPGTPRSSR